MEGEAVAITQGTKELHGTLASYLWHSIEHHRHLVVVLGVVQRHRVNL